MNCKKIRDLILTDYLDAQCAEGVNKLVRTHVAECSECKKFEAEARRICVESFADAGRETPPSYVWSRIQKAILSQEKKTVFEIFRERLAEVFRVKSPAFSLAITIFVVIISVTAIGSHKLYTQVTNRRLAESYLQEQLEYLASAQTQSGADMVDFGTPIEEYILEETSKG